MAMTTLRKWGNSNGVILPKEILSEYNLKTNDQLDIIPSEEGILLVVKEKKVAIDDLLDGFDGRITSEELVDWGSPVGGEVW